MSDKNWPVANHHFDASGNLASLRQKYNFSDKNSDIIDVLDGVAKSFAATGEYSFINEGLIPEKVDSLKVKFSQGNFFHSSQQNVFEQPFYKYVVPSEITKEFRSNTLSKNSFIHVGKIFDEPAQSISSTDLRLNHRVTGAGDIVDSSFGPITVAAPVVYLADDLERAATGIYDAVNGIDAGNRRKISIIGTPGDDTPRDCLVSYTPMTEVSWIDPTTVLSRVLSATSTYNEVTTTIIDSGAKFASSDVGKMIQFVTSSTVLGQKRRITRRIGTGTLVDSVEVDLPFDGVPQIGDTYKMFDADSLLPVNPRLDVVGVRKKTYRGQRIINTITSAGVPTSTSTIARYNTTFEFVVFEDVKCLGSNNEFIDTSLTNLSDFDFIPLGLALVTSAGVSYVTSAKPWITMFRNRRLDETNIIQNGSFSMWETSPAVRPVAWESPQTGYTLSEETSLVKFGTSAMKIVAGSPADTKAVAFKGTLSELNLQLGDVILFSAWARRTAGAGNIALRIVLTNSSTDATAPIDEVIGHLSVGRDEYESVECVMTMPVNNSAITNSTYVFFYVDISAGSTTAIIDGVTATKLTSTYSIKGSPIMSVAGTQVIDSNLLISKDVEIKGNLTVQGDTTTVNTANLSIEDNIITLNKNESGAGITHISGTAGIEIERGSLTNVNFLFKESASRWEIDNGMGLYVPGMITGTVTSAKYSDLAEYFETEDDLKCGDAVSIVGYRKVGKYNGRNLLGFVSTNPGLILGQDLQEAGKKVVLVGVAGSIPVKTLDTSIQCGDEVAFIDGQITKATPGDLVKGIAQENVNNGKVLIFTR